MRWNIICDSSCDLFDLEEAADGVSYKSVPFFINIEEREFVDDEKLDTKELINSVKESKSISTTACPSPQSWLEMMGKAENNICVTISKKLSGSYDSAVVASEMFKEENTAANVAIIDSRATGPSAVLAVRKIVELIKAGKSFDMVVSEAEAYIANINTCFTLSSFENLVKNGRMSKLSGILAKTLEFWGVGVEKNGRIAVKTKVRGKKKVLSALVDIMRENGLCGNEVVISHCHNGVMAEKLKTEIESVWKNVNVSVIPTRGLNSYYAEDGGLIMAY